MHRAPTTLGLAVLVAVPLGTFLPACGIFESGACIYGGSLSFCHDASADECSEFWCDRDFWEYCAYYEATTCDDIGLSEETDGERNYSPPAGADWTFGTPRAGWGGSSEVGGGATGACAYFDYSLNRILCKQATNSRTSCGGKFLGEGTSCQQISCSSSNPDSCTAPGGRGGGGGGGSCESSCPSEVSDVQLDSFCRMACCHAVTGFPDRAETTCAQGASLGTSSCRYCR